MTGYCHIYRVSFCKIRSYGFSTIWGLKTVAKKTIKRSGQKKRTGKVAPKSANIKSAGARKAKSSTRRSTGKKTAKKTVKAAKKTVKAAKKTAKAKSSAPKAVTKKKVAKAKKAAIVKTPKKRASSKSQGNNGLLPKLPVRSVESQKPVKLRKTHLKPHELEEFRQLLIEKRQELMGDISHLQNEVLHQGSSGEPSNASVMPIHMADIGSDTWEQELTMGLIENERHLIREINEALDRIDNKTYGICMATNRPISKSRLRARPWAKYCIEHARRRELGLA